MSWNVPEIHNGNPQQFTELLVYEGFQAVCLKCADGPYIHRMRSDGPWPIWGENIRQELIDALREAGIKIYFWHFIYGTSPNGELSVAKNQCGRFNPDGYIWDAESVFESKQNAESNARLLASGLREEFPNISQSLCWWAFPKSPISGVEWHPVKVAKAFLEVVEYIMPMEYWGGSTPADAVGYLYKSLDVWRSITSKPITPIGRSYIGDGGRPTPEAILAFANSVYSSKEEYNLIGNSWWSLDSANKNSSWMTALKQTPAFDIPVSIPEEEVIRRLMEEHKYLFPEIYPEG